MTENPLSLTIVVATYNRLSELQSMLDTLLPQIARRPVEVVIVDDCSTDNTHVWLQATFADNPAVIPLRAEKNGGPGPARNVGLAIARGRYFLPIDSDFLLIDGAIDVVLSSIEQEARYPLLFFPCVQYPAMTRLNPLKGRREIDYSAFISESLGELIPVASLGHMRAKGLAYPNLRAGGESLLWADILTGEKAVFIDSPIILYRTDVGQRICTLEYQMKNPAALAAVSDALVSLYSRDDSEFSRRARAQKYLAAGTYHLLAGDVEAGRKRLFAALRLGCRTALPPLIVSLLGVRIFRSLFGFYRTRLKRAYL